MAADTTFTPQTIPIRKLKDVVRTCNYSFWHYEHNYRNRKNFSYSTGIILDIDSDSGMTLEEGERLARSMNCYVLIATSQNHMKDKKKDGKVINGPCFRVIIPTNRIFYTSSDLLSAIQFVNKTYFHGKADPKAMLPSQMFIPSPENATIIEIQSDNRYDPDDLRRDGISKGDSFDAVVLVRNAWTVEKFNFLKDSNGVPLTSLPLKKTVVYCPFCDHIHSETVSGWLLDRKEGEDRRAIRCSHCRKMYLSEAVNLKDDQFVEKVCYTADSFSDASEPVMWIVKDVVGQSEMFSCYGDPGSGKSVAMMQLARSVADTSGKIGEWLGFPIERHGPVLYILTDGSHRSLRERIRTISGYSGIPRPNNLMILHNQGVYQVWKDEVERVVKARKPVMIILDSLAMSSDKGDENQVEDQKGLAKTLQVWSLEYNLAFCLMHHTNKAAADKAFHQNNFRGSSYWIGVISSLLEFRRCENRKNQYKLVKSRDGSPEAQNIREVAYEEFTPSTPGTYNLSQDQMVKGYRFLGPVQPSGTIGRKQVSTWARDVFKPGETKTYKDTLEAIQMKYARGQSWAKDILKDWKDLGYVTINRNADGTKSYTYKE